MSADGVLELVGRAEEGGRFLGRWLAESPPSPVVGEVVFNTAMTGYQEICTDPSYAGQIVVLTYPLVGSYGAAAAWTESRAPALKALVVHRAERASHGGAMTELSDYLSRRGIPVLTGVDTRALTRRLRDCGTLLGVLHPASEPLEAAAVQEAIRGFSLRGIVDTVTTPEAYVVDGDGPTIAVVDYGLKTGIVTELQRRGFRIVVLPATATAADLDAAAPGGVVLSNGPGDPADLLDRLPLVRHAVAQHPTLGICLGHQVVALAAGGRTYPLKFGHHGSNHPVQDVKTGRIDITSHNHGYAVDAASLPDGYRVRFTNLNDHTVEGLEHEHLPVLTVQHHPEAGPGPHDASHIFDEFAQRVHERGAAPNA